MTWQKVLVFIGKILTALLPIISPEIKKLYQDAILGVYKRALKTPNPTDDVFAKILCDIAGVNTTGVTPD